MLPQILVELELLTSQWVDKRCDHFEETPDQERNYVMSELALGICSKKVFYLPLITSARPRRSG
jgi:hypothetical protein